MSPVGQSGVALTRLSGISVSPDNTHVAVTGYDTGSIIVYHYTPGDTHGADASLDSGQETGLVMSTAKTQGTTWLDDSHVLAFAKVDSTHGSLLSVDINSITSPPTELQSNITLPDLGGENLDIEYNPTVSDRYVYGMYSGFTNSTTLDTRLFVFDKDNNYAPVVPDGLSIQESMGTDSSRRYCVGC